MSDINEVGATAFVAAVVRAREKDRSRPLFVDPYAEWFVSPRARAMVHRLHSAFPPVVDVMRFRTCYFNRFVQRGIQAGATQVVLLGCGMDMRAHHLAATGVTFFEVDQGEVLRLKTQVLAKHGIEQPASLHCNYLEADVPGGLAAIGCDLNAPTLMVWEGNTMYLPPDSILPFVTLLTDRMPFLRLGLDYFGIDMRSPSAGTEKKRLRLDRIERAMGASFSTGLADITGFERTLLLRIVESGEIMELAGEFKARDVVDAYPEDFRALVGVYRYCVLERKQ